MLSIAMITWLISLISSSTALKDNCELFWSSRQSLGYEQGIQVSRQLVLLFASLFVVYLLFGLFT
ncbi:unnamed protein product [Nippostrongylus brasiliensis]|uniref:Protein-export membrane protein SecG n=1 Tax=Nippostrongylus brasiliensis TaxID=27835 RepID=A0A0N4XKY7_NIPBR|nr:unnamed protein product [Nippostrongylus brasiliensis]